MSKDCSPTRFFNKIEYSGKTVKKTIYDKAKGNAEIFFYKNIPQKEKIYFPKIKKITTNRASATYEMDWIPHKDVSQVYLTNKLSPKKFRYLLNAIDNYWNQTQTQLVSKKHWETISTNIIIKRMDRRWKAYEKMNIYKKMYRTFIKEHNVCLKDIKNDLRKELKTSISQSKETTLFRTHGDLCFSNMFLVNKTLVKFVDPRGGQSKQDLFIPLIYDLAKISQCVYGNYDGINGKKNVLFNSQKIIFKKWLHKRRISIRTLRLVESSHFLSLLVLHADRPEKHYLFLTAAINAYKEALLCNP